VAVEYSFVYFPTNPFRKNRRKYAWGTAKGNPEYFVAEIQPGKVLYEMDGVEENVAREAFALAAAKLPLKTTFVFRHVG